MNWLTNFVRPKLRALVARKEAPENLWLKCPKCEQMLFMRAVSHEMLGARHSSGAFLSFLRGAGSRASEGAAARQGV